MVFCQENDSTYLGVQFYPLEKLEPTEIYELESLAGEIDFVDDFKYLGVSIDKRLSFVSHIVSIQKRCALWTKQIKIS